MLKTFLKHAQIILCIICMYVSCVYHMCIMCIICVSYVYHVYIICMHHVCFMCICTYIMCMCHMYLLPVCTRFSILPGCLPGPGSSPVLCPWHAAFPCPLAKGSARCHLHCTLSSRHTPFALGGSFRLRRNLWLGKIPICSCRLPPRKDLRRHRHARGRADACLRS